MRGSRAPSPGFTVVEVLVALALLTLGAIAVVTSVVASLQALGGPVETDAFQRWAEDQVLALTLDEIEEGGQFTLPDDRTIGYEGEVEEGPLPDLMRCEIILTLEGEEMRFQRYFFEAGSMDEGEAEGLRRRLLPLLR